MKRSVSVTKEMNYFVVKLYTTYLFYIISDITYAILLAKICIIALLFVSSSTTLLKNDVYQLFGGKNRH